MTMTVEDLARELQVSVKTVRRHDIEGKLPEPLRIGRQLRWPRQMIADWLAAGSPDRLQWKWRPRRTGS
jgi:excisionase family DNA binding protein